MSAAGRLAGAVRAGWLAAAPLVWPVCCAGCGRPDLPVCAGCRTTVEGPARPVRVAWSWSAGGLPTGPGGRPATGQGGSRATGDGGRWAALGDCGRWAAPEYGGWWAAAEYGGVPARLVVAWKERGRHDLTGVLAAGLVVPVLTCLAAADPHGTAVGPALLVPVPTRRSAVRRRGSDLTADLAGTAARLCARSSPAVDARAVRALRHRRRVADQAGLDVSRRRANLTGALEVRPASVAALAGRPVVVVDDVVTTGTTAAEAARALTEAGARVVGACFLCVTVRQQGVHESRRGLASVNGPQGHPPPYPG